MSYKLKERLLRIIETGDLQSNQVAGLRVLAPLIRPVYVPVIEERAHVNLDRTSSFFFGLPWTSEEFPWPDTCENSGFEYYLGGPLLQLNLDQLGIATGEDVGSGLLQVFLPQQSYSFAAYGRDGTGIEAAVRVIPARAIERKDDMTPFLFEEMSPLEICRCYWEMEGVPDSYDELETDPRKMYSDECWSIGRLEMELEDSGFLSDGYKLGPALAIVDWKHQAPEAHIELSSLSDNEISTIFDDWQLGTDEWGGIWFDNTDIIESLLGQWHIQDKYPIPALFGWPLSSNGQLHAIETGEMPLIVFEGLMKYSGDWVEVFSDTSFWTYGWNI